MMCWDGLTAAQAARIGFGLAVAVLAALATAALAWESWIAWREEYGEEDEDEDRASGTSARTEELAGE